MTTPLPTDNVIDVRAYGAVGDGVTDDTVAIKSAVAAVLASASYRPDSGMALTKKLYFPSGRYLVTQADTLMFTPATTQNTWGASLVYGLEIYGDGKHQSEIVFASTATASTDPRRNNLMTCANRLRGAKIHDLGFHSTNANQSLAYLWCSASNDGTYPAYGSGAQNDIWWSELHLTGSWLRGWGFDGDTNANLNSEQVWHRVYVNQVAWGDAGIRSGFAPYPAQESQFLNYAFHDCEFEYTSGTMLDFEMGGSINIIGGSWILCDTTQNTVSTMIKLGKTNIADGSWRFLAQGVRFEVRSQYHRIIDCGWVTGNVTFVSCSDSALAFMVNQNKRVPDSFPQFGNTSPATHVYDWTTWGTGPVVRYQDCQLMGYHRVSTNAAMGPTGRVIYDGCQLVTEPQATFLRSSNAVAPNVFRDLGLIAS
ncbi:glycosyl hydrolase family 28-related protein [Nocardia sp. NPDC058058]|uniref:glycosyl hydrolase family 28-related protein n=1 Tax=Nocardia sp. NPDC058058 TaxID=3346317 RepID=UPI0036DC20AA